jgi:hypothetical protein
MRSRTRPRSNGRAALFALSALSLIAVRAASAAVCGDDVSGARIACSCGDVLVSDTRVQPNDPVVTERCLLEGLIVRAPKTAESIRLDLGGLAITGRGYGTGIRVDFGGSDGAVITGGSLPYRGQIVGFSMGIVAARSNALRRLERMRIRGNRRDGIRLHTDGTVIVDVESSDNGGDGFVLSGSGGRLENIVAARNASTGINLKSS